MQIGRYAAVALVVLSSASCSSSDPPPPPPPQQAPETIDCKPTPSIDAPWLRDFLGEAIGDLSKAPRASDEARAAARENLKRRISAIGSAWEVSTQEYPKGANIIATLPPKTNASEPKKRVILGAHFDSVANSPGANDNASGVAVVLAAARLVTEMTCRSSAITIAFFDKEEEFLLGSKEYAATLPPGEVRAVHTIDQVAWDADGDKIFELEKPSPELEAEWKAAAAIVGVTLSITPTEGTDHQAFRARGFPAVGLTEEYVGGDTSPVRHEAGDTSASITPYLDYTVLAAKLTARVVMTELDEPR
jgi:hypothetical protein